LVDLSWKRIWPLALACAAFLLAFALQLAAVLKATHGEQLFVLDDPYIHASIAKNLLIYHTFGISPDTFASASSSLLWPFLFAALFSLFGLHLWVVLAFNVLLGLLALCLCHAVWRFLAPAAPSLAPAAADILEAIALLAIVMAGSLVSLVFLGMEHILQFITVLSLLYAAVVAARSEKPKPVPGRVLAWLYLSGIAAVATRFEGAFAVCLVCCFLFLRGRRSLALLLAIASALPILLFGWYSLRHGGYFFPNSLLIKAVHGRSKLDGLRNLLGHYARSQGMLWIWLLACAELALCFRFLGQAMLRSGVQLALLIVLLTVFHCQFGAVGWAYRYEAYLVEMCLLACGFLAADLLQEYSRTAPSPQAAHWASGFAIPTLLLLLILAGAARVDHTQTLIRRGVENVYDQQLQTARFLAEYYPRQTVAVNDVGVVSYLRSSPTLDLFGLGSDVVTRLIMDGRWNTASIEAEVRKSGASVAAVYDNWFRGTQQLPASWTRVAEWTIPDFPTHLVVWGLKLPPPEGVLGGMTVSFYATDPAAVQRLSANLHSFSPCLPPEVSQRVQGEALHGGGACALNLAELDQPSLKVASPRNFLMKK
jgi:hypothetical protein